MQTFSERVIKIALTIPKGRVATYGRIARAAGGGNQASRSVTGILSKAYDSGEKSIPFHRIVYADGRIWIKTRYKKERLALYRKEGIVIHENNRIKNFREVLLNFT